MRERIAFVCQRYGPDVNGGSELYCRQVAEKLSGRYDVTVYTSCAKDYNTWINCCPPGEEDLNGVHVKRYPVTGQRDSEQEQKAFEDLCRAVRDNPLHTDEEERQWLEKQGPCCPELIEAVREEAGSYRAVLFMTYLYYTAAVGLQQGIPNALLIPTTHDEPWIYQRVYDLVFDGAKGFIWLTPEERAFARKRFPFVRRKPEVITGIGMDPPEGPLPEIPEQLRGQPYLVYAGRIDPNKGCREMFAYFRQYQQSFGGKLKLALMGKAAMEIPEEPDIVPLGFVSEEMKLAVMRDALALVLFSPFESLSMVVLESMMMGRPVLVREKCAVLKGHCLRSGAGLWFDSYPEFAGAVNYLLSHEKEYEQMRENGKAYVREQYSWDSILDRYQWIIGQMPEPQA